MDLSAILKAEISKKRKQIDTAVAQSAAAGDAVVDPERKYIKRVHLECATTSANDNDTTLSAFSITAESANGGESASVEKSPDEDEARILPEDELVRRFRVRGEPIRLFGETQKMRLLRLKVIESSQVAEVGDSQRGFKDASDRVESELMDEILNKGTVLSAKDLQAKAKRLALMERYAPDLHLISEEFLKSDRDKCLTLIYVFWKKLLYDWESDLNARSEDEKRSLPWRKELTLLRQSIDYLKPFFAQLKSKSLGDDILTHVSEICHFMNDKEYLKANDSYLNLSIGNAVR